MHKMIHCAVGAAVALLVANASPAAASTSCKLGNGIKHIVYLQFDNVHLRRDNPNVPSDLEQIPSLLNFLRDNGTLLTDHHTPLISHTSVDIVTSLTGVYGEKFGFAVGNSFGFFDPTGTPHFQSAFAYWTDLVNEGTTSSPVNVPQMVDQRGKIHPAPWVPFTRAGCDVGAFSLANIELENTGIGGTDPVARGTDINTAFGPHPRRPRKLRPRRRWRIRRPMQKRGRCPAPISRASPFIAPKAARCAPSRRTRGPTCSHDEPGGYNGFQALFGNKYVAPAINGGQGFVLDLDGNHVTDSLGNDGFPSGFSPTPSQSLGYVAQMLEHGVDVVYFYIEDAHDNHNYPGCSEQSGRRIRSGRGRLCMPTSGL